MAMWVDKYRPKDLMKLDYHKEQAMQLKNLPKQGDFPPLMFYGPSGAGKKTRIMCLLREIYGAGVERLRNETMTFTTPSNKKVEVLTVGSNYHIEVNPSDAGFHDRVVIIDLIKRIAQTAQIDPTGQREFKVIIITEADELTKDAQHALRRTMEKYIATCRMILVVTSTARVIPAIRSRCLGIRVSAPSNEEITTVLKYVAKKENLNLPLELAERIAQKSKRNLRRAILTLEACRVEQYPFRADQHITDIDWEVYLKETANQILLEQTPSNLEKIRERLYELLGQGILPDMIFKGLLENLVRNVDISLKAKTLEYACEFERRMRKGSKHIYHLEAFVANFMNIYKQYITDMVIDDFE